MPELVRGLLSVGVPRTSTVPRPALESIPQARHVGSCPAKEPASPGKLRSEDAQSEREEQKSRARQNEESHTDQEYAASDDEDDDPAGPPNGRVNRCSSLGSPPSPPAAPGFPLHSERFSRGTRAADKAPAGIDLRRDRGQAVAPIRRAS
jgi:hypothetical protein